MVTLLMGGGLLKSVKKTDKSHSSKDGAEQGIRAYAHQFAASHAIRAL
jgi:hypothetical protein